MLCRGALRTILVGLFAAALACGRADSGAHVDSSMDTTRAPAAPPRVTSEWNAELGTLLVVPSDSDNSAVVLYPTGDDAATGSEAVTLVNGGGDTVRATLTHTDSVECGDVPMARLAAVPAGTWSIGMGRHPAPLVHVDSIESLPSADSSRLAADIARLASALPMPRNSRFGGLPFAVVSARRFTLDGRQYVAAHLARRLNQEAQPLEERTFILAERADSSTNSRLAVAYSQRSEGTEDTAEHFDLLAVLKGKRSPLLLISRDQLSQTRYDLLERQDDGTWRVRWSRTLSC